MEVGSIGRMVARQSSGKVIGVGAQRKVAKALGGKSNSTSITVSIFEVTLQGVNVASAVDPGRSVFLAHCLYLPLFCNVSHDLISHQRANADHVKGALGRRCGENGEMECDL